MTHSEATKQLMELQVIWNRGNDAEAVEYNKHILDTINYFITQTVPLSVIEKIKANIDKLPDLNPDYPMDMATHVSKWAVFDIIDKAVKEIEHESDT